MKKHNFLFLFLFLPVFLVIAEVPGYRIVQKDTLWEFHMTLTEESLLPLFKSVEEGNRAQLLVTMTHHLNTISLKQGEIQVFHSFIFGKHPIYGEYFLTSRNQTHYFDSWQTLLFDLSTKNNLFLEELSGTIEVEYTLIPTYLVPPFSLINYFPEYNQVIRKKISFEVAP